MDIQVVTIEKDELIRLIDCSVTQAVARILSPPMQENMTKNEVCKHLRRSSATITRWMKKGLPYHGEGHPTFKRSEVDRWLARK